MSFENDSEKLDDAVIVALGSNMPADYGTCPDLLKAAVKALKAEGIAVTRLSKFWRSDAWPDASDPPYANAVALVETELEAADLMKALHAIETAFGRDRSQKNAPRTLDLDLIAHGRTVMDEPHIPHPRAHERLFVMGPLAEIAPDWTHPVLKMRAIDLARTAAIGADAKPL